MSPVPRPASRQHGHLQRQVLHFLQQAAADVPRRFGSVQGQRRHPRRREQPRSPGLHQLGTVAQTQVRDFDPYLVSFFYSNFLYSGATPTVSTGWAPCVIPKTKTTGSGSTATTSLFPSGTCPAATKIALATTAPRAGSGQTPTAMPNSTTFASTVSFITQKSKIWT